MEILSTVLLLSSPLGVIKQHHSVTALPHEKSRCILRTLYTQHCRQPLSWDRVAVWDEMICHPCNTIWQLLCRVVSILGLVRFNTRQGLRIQCHFPRTNHSTLLKPVKWEYRILPCFFPLDYYKDQMRYCEWKHSVSGKTLSNLSLNTFSTLFISESTEQVSIKPHFDP